MLKWTRQGAAWVASLSLADGRWGKVVLVAERSNPKGAMLVLSPRDQGPVATLSLQDCLDTILPDQAIDIYCMQERAFGSGRLAPPEAS